MLEGQDGLLGFWILVWDRIPLVRVERVASCEAFNLFDRIGCETVLSLAITTDLDVVQGKDFFTLFAGDVNQHTPNGGCRISQQSDLDF